jgi:hypothetical protein
MNLLAWGEQVQAYCIAQIPLGSVREGEVKGLVPVQRARRPPQQSTPDRLTLRGQGIGGGVS